MIARYFTLTRFDLMQKSGGIISEVFFTETARIFFAEKVKNKSVLNCERSFIKKAEFWGSVFFKYLSREVMQFFHPSLDPF